MALEEITTEMDVQKPAKTKDKQGPKKPLASMKKKYVKGVEVMDTELRSNVPVKQVKKESQDFADAMEKARKMTASEIAAKDKPKIKVMKKLGKAAGKAVHELPHDEKPVVNEMMKQKATMPLSSPIMESKDDLPGVKLKPGSRPMTVEEGEAFLNGAKAEDIKSGKYKRETPMGGGGERKVTDEDRKNKMLKAINEKSKSDQEKKSKLESLKKPAPLYE